MKVVFLDRDGVLIENVPDYVRSWDDVIYFDQAFEALKLLQTAGYGLVVVTNQSVIGRGLMPLKTVQELNDRILAGFEETGIRITGRYMCPHAPEENCPCRKPKPGMIFQARDELGIELAHSFFVGDAYTDMQAAQAAGVRGILVRTGRGAVQETLLPPASPWPVVNNLLEAAAMIQRSE